MKQLHKANKYEFVYVLEKIIRKIRNIGNIISLRKEFQEGQLDDVHIFRSNCA